jgi:hypothetical protein
VPDRPFVQQPGTIIHGSPALDRAGVEVHDPVLGNADSLESAALDEAIEAGG